MSRRLASKRKFKGNPPQQRKDNAASPIFDEVSTVNSYLYFTRPYPFNPDEVVGKKGIKKYTEMSRDEQIKAGIFAKQLAVVAPGWEVVPPPDHETDAEKTADEEMVDFLKMTFNDMDGSFDTKLLEMLTALTYGFSIGEKVFWLIDYGQFDGKIGLKNIKFRNPEGFEFRSDPFGNLPPDGVLQALRPLPRDKFVIYSYRKKFDNFYGDSDLRECYRAFWCKDNLLKFMMITMERYGEPVWVFTVEGTTPKANLMTLENFMRDIQSKSGILLPANIKADPKHPAPEAGRGYIPVLEYLDGLIRSALQMPSLIGFSATQSHTGSLARAQTERESFDMVMQYIRHDVEANLNEQVVKQLIDFNFEVTDSKYPIFRFKELDQEQKQAQFEEYIKALSSKALTKTRDDEDYFRDRLEIPALPPDYPVAGEVTAEMQKQQDAQAQALRDAQVAALKNPQPPPEGGQGGPSGNSQNKPGGPVPPEKTPPNPAEAKKTSDIQFESESQRHAREYIDYKNKQALQNHLINNDRNRDLTGPDAVHIGSIMPKSISMQYMDVPGVDQMHEAMGMDPSLDTEVKKYHQAKAKLFAKQPRRRVDMSQLTLTQTHVHKGRVEDMSHDASALNDAVQVLKHGQSNYLMDGHHRVAARHKAGKKFVMAHVYSTQATKYTLIDPNSYNLINAKLSQISEQGAGEWDKRLGNLLVGDDHAYAMSPMEKRFDYQAAKKILDTSEQKVRDELKGEFKQTLDDLLKWLDAHKEMTSSDVRALTVSSPPEVQQIIQDMFENAWTDGRDAGVDEMPAKVKKLPAVKEVKTFGWASQPCWVNDEIEPYFYNTGKTFRDIFVAGKEWRSVVKKRYANAFEPTEALQAFENRAWLIKDVVDGNLQAQVRYELFEHIKGGRTLNETIDNIRRIFEPWVGDPSKIEPDSENILQAYRLENIVRTETTWAYNQGRVAVGDAAGDYLLGYQFSAILDDRTTETCRKANGLIFRKEDPNAIKLIPPLHWQCRSTLIYVTTDDVPVAWSNDSKINAAVVLIPKNFK